MRLSPNFTLSEFTRSETAFKMNLDNTPSKNVIENLKNLCRVTLEVARQHTGKPIRISSGYRSLAVNKAVGGSTTSQHRTGEAADAMMAGHNVRDFMRVIIESGAEFDQLIDEYGSWVHVSCKRQGRNRQQIMSARTVAGKTVYTQLSQGDICQG